MARLSRLLPMCLLFSPFALVLAQSSSTPDYKSKNLPVERRVADLLGRMTLEEKAAQVTSLWDTSVAPVKARITDESGKFSPEKAREVLKYGLGEISRPGENRGPREEVEHTNAIQKFVMENTRLSIPVLFHEEGLHGHAAPKGTHFPQAIALGSTWDPALIERVFTAVAKEIRARGVHHVLAPVLDLARDPRWGRIEETYSEDPYLVARLGAAAIRGFQGQGTGIDKQHVYATLKHYAVHGSHEGGTNVAPGNYSERIIREQFLYPFQVAVAEANAASVMPSYNEVDGIPSHRNQWLLKRILRQEWGFQGFIASDYFGIRELMTTHHVAGDPEQAAKMALEAGVDLELPYADCYANLPQMVREGKVSEAVLDRAVARVLRAKFLAGLFDDPYNDPDAAERITNNEEHRRLARQAALEAIVLLKNDNNLLPLDRKKIKTLAVIGPNANKMLLGGYSDDPGYFVTVLEGVRRKAGDSMTVVYAEGCKITEDDANWWKDEVRLSNPAEDRKRIAEAVKTAATADTILLVLGGNEAVSREAWAASHLGDVDTLELVGLQNELAEAIVKTGKPVVVLLLNGRPYSINYIAEHVPATLEGWYLGQETGNAVADVVFGGYNPGGRLPVTIPRNVGQLPVYYYQKPSAKRGYLFSSKEPLFPFGHGLSYTTFEYRNLKVTPEKIRPAGESVVSVEVKNTGKMAGDEVVQMYIRDEVSSVTRPVKELRGFERVHLATGETKTVQFRLTPEKLSLLDRNMHRVVEPGTFEIMVGGSSVKTTSVKLEVVAN